MRSFLRNNPFIPAFVQFRHKILNFIHFRFCKRMFNDEKGYCIGLYILAWVGHIRVYLLLIYARGKVWVKSLKTLYQGGHWKRGAEE